MPLLESDIRGCKPWRLRKMATANRKALAYARDPTKRVPYRDDMIQTIKRQLQMIQAELNRTANQ